MMSCLPEFTYALYADDELPADEARRVEEHLAACARCRDLLAALRAENRVLTATLEEAEGEAAAPAAVPAWRRAAAWTGVAVATAALVLHAVLGGPAALPAGFDWLSLVLEVVFFLALNAGVLSQLVGALAVATMGALTVAGVVFLLRRPRRVLVGLAALSVMVGLSGPALALETRGGATVIIASGETVDGTLVVSGDAVEIDGRIDGDLIVAARTLVVRGRIRGDLVFGGVTADLSGTVEGNVYTFAGELRVRGRVTRSVYGFNRTADLEPASRVEADVNLVGHGLSATGGVGRSVWVFGATTRVTGAIGRDLTVRGHRLELSAPARVGGNVTAHVERSADARIDSDVPIGGRREIRLASPGAALYAEPRFYFWVAVNLFGALLLGLGALLLAPRFFHASAEAVGAWSRSLGLGLVVLVGGPVALILVALTLVGLPLALVALGLYLCGLYAAQILVGAFLGRALLGSRGASTREWLLALLVGLLALTIAFQLPIVGTTVRLVVFCLGLGAFSYQLYRSARPRRA